MLKEGAPRTWTEVLKLLEDPLTDRLVARELIKEVPRHTYQYYAKNRAGRPAVFVDVSEVAKKADLHLRSQNRDVDYVTEYLASACVPIGSLEEVVRNGKQKESVQRYNFTTKNFEEESVTLLKSAKEARFDQMRRPPVRFVGPKPETIPSFRVLQKDYARLGPLLVPFGVTNPNQLRTLGTSIAELVGDNPPVTAYLTSEGSFVERSKALEMSAYLGKRLEQARKTAIISSYEVPQDSP